MNAIEHFCIVNLGTAKNIILGDLRRNTLKMSVLVFSERNLFITSERDEY